MLTREKILASVPQHEDVNVPEWGDTVRVKAISGFDRVSYVRAQFGEDGKLKDPDRQDAVLVAFTVVDEAGNRMFTVDDVEALANLSAAALDRVVKVASRLCGFSKADVDDAKKN